MTNPITHLLWGYTISKNISKEEKFIVLGLFMSIFLDIDAFPGFKHHGFMHTPLFVIILSSIIYFLSRSKIVFKICFVNLIFHLILDTVGTRAPVMWFYPINDSSFAVGTEISLVWLAVIKLILFFVPVSYIWYRYKKYGENPFDLIKFVREKLGRRNTILLILVFFVLLIYFGVTEYLLEII